jgi:hypothetical protein
MSVTCWDLHILNNKLKIFRIGDRGLSLGCPLPLAVLGGEECGAADLSQIILDPQGVVLLFTKEYLSCHSLYHMHEISSISTALEWVL